MHLLEFEGNLMSWGWQRFGNTAQDLLQHLLWRWVQSKALLGLSAWAALHQGLSITPSRLLLNCLQN